MVVFERVGIFFHGSVDSLRGLAEKMLASLPKPAAEPVPQSVPIVEAEVADGQ
jgi:hypothetical protein